jgi:undecaprenyl-diphosphatase
MAEKFPKPPFDTHPSGHAVQVGALAAAGSRMIARPARFFIWLVALARASTRLALLAHDLMDVVAGLLLGIAVDRVVSRTLSSLWTGSEC